MSEIIDLKKLWEDLDKRKMANKSFSNMSKAEILTFCSLVLNQTSLKLADEAFNEDIPF